MNSLISPLTVGYLSIASLTLRVDGNGQAIVSLVKEDGTLKELALSNFENWQTTPGGHRHPITGTPCKEVEI
ncbi:hypothetical protein RJZ56_003482 [Blastomyces dermatitidis]